MSFTQFDDLGKLTNENIYFELLSSKKELFNLRLKRIMRQPVRSHLFKVNKRKVAQLLTLISKRSLTK